MLHHNHDWAIHIGLEVTMQQKPRRLQRVDPTDVNSRLDSMPIWLAANTGLYLVVAIVFLVIGTLLNPADAGNTSGVFVGFLWGLPTIIISMAVPTFVLTAILWTVRVRSRLLFRAIAAALLLLPLVLADGSAMLIYEAIVQVTYSQIMIRSRLD
jgi:hypothetical protein